ncbi:MAG: hypothetical protein P4M01_09370 [Acidobacteriota bacterium]|nr:hypothetical protein [Acidobacteriota bacterium]
MPRAFTRIAVLAILLMPLAAGAAGKFDGEWSTTLTCPPKGNTDGYTWTFPGTIRDNLYHGERGTAGAPGYLAIDGPVKADGSAKLTANGIIASRKYSRGMLAHKGEEYGYDIKAQFNEKDGSGQRNQGMGIVGRPCTFEFTRQ